MSLEGVPDLPARGAYPEERSRKGLNRAADESPGGPAGRRGCRRAPPDESPQTGAGARTVARISRKRAAASLHLKRACMRSEAALPRARAAG